jgi:hypothetical protein
MAAIAAARRGARVTVCEQLDRPGAKLLVTGGGRCNVTNLAGEAEFVAAFGRQGRFILPALRAMGPEELRQFLADRGVPTHAEDGVHVFPRSNRAADVLKALLEECAKLGVEVRCEAPVTELMLSGGMAASAGQAAEGSLEAQVRGVVAGGGELPADAVIVATGGRSYARLGGAGGGYTLARQAGHRLVQPTPALAALVTRETWPAKCAGISVGGVRVWIDLPRHRGSSRTGDVLFTHTGISGPAVLDLSGDVAVLLERGVAVPVRMGLFAGESGGEWQRRLEEWQRSQPRRQVGVLLGEHLPRALAGVLCHLAGEVGATRAAELPKTAQRRLAGLLTALPLTVTATAGFEQAMVTRGGVALSEVDPATMGSRLAAGLHFAGEVLDLDGPCGGYNLQWAFSSGYLAGDKAAGGQLAACGE